MSKIKNITIYQIQPLLRSFSIKIEEYHVNDETGQIEGIVHYPPDHEFFPNVPKRDVCAFQPGQYDQVVRYLEHHGLTDENQTKLVMDSVNVLWTPEIIESYREWEQVQAEEENRLKDEQLAAKEASDR